MHQVSFVVSYWRDFLRYFVPGFLLILAACWSIADREHGRRYDELKADQRLAVSLGAQALTRHVHFAVADLVYLQRSQSLKDAANSSERRNLSRLAEDFANFSLSRRVYDQIRWLDANGQELVRVDLQQDEARIVPPEALQNKADRYYFRESIGAPPAQVLLSRLDLNVERGQVEIPHKPMLRLAAPVADNAGNTRGVLVLNFLAAEMLRRFDTSTERFGRYLSLVDGDGYWLRSQVPNDEWGFMFNDPSRSLAIRSPDVWARLQGDDGQFELAGDLWTYQTYLPLSEEESDLAAMGVPAEKFRWIIVSHIPAAAISAIHATHRPAIWQTFIVLNAILLIACVAIARQKRAAYTRDQRFQGVFDNAMVGMATTSPEKKWLTVNPALCRILGYERDALLQKTWMEITHPDDLAGSLAEFEATLRGERDSYCIQKRFIRGDGGIVIADISARLLRAADGSPDYFAIVVEDVTARQQAEQQNRLFNRRSAALLELPRAAESMDEHAFMQHAIDQVERLTESQIGFIHFVNDDGNSIELVTWSISTLSNYCTAVFDRHYPIDAAGIWADAARQLKPVVVNDYAQATGKKGLPDGHARLDRFISIPVIENGKVRMLMGVGNCPRPYEPRDVETAQLIGSETWRIVQRRRTEALLAAASQVVNASPVVCFRWSPENGWPVVFVSDSVRQWGYSPDDLIAQDPPFASLVHPDDLERVVGEVERHLANADESFEQEYRLITRDGRVIWVLDRTRVTHDSNRQPLWFDGVVTDITERKLRQTELSKALEDQRRLNKRLEEANNQLMQSEKMASIGQLAAGVAHELNNPIGFVHSNLGTLDAYLNDLMTLIEAYQKLVDNLAAGTVDAERIHQLREQLDFEYLRGDIFQLVAESKDGLSRVKKIVQDLKTFSRVGEQEWQVADLHQGLDSTLNIVWNELKYKCQVVKEYGDLPPVNCLISQLNQVFMNILVNASHAIEKQGTITIRTRLLDPGHVQVEISDTGAGIPKENLTRIFDPFFTTKPVGKGTGLGLSLSYGIIERHRGKIEVHSEVGVGTTFSITLPISPEQAASPGTEEKTA